MNHFLGMIPFTHSCPVHSPLYDSHEIKIWIKLFKTLCNNLWKIFRNVYFKYRIIGITDTTLFLSYWCENLNIKYIYITLIKSLITSFSVKCNNSKRKLFVASKR